jgi:hypothetical protein
MSNEIDYIRHFIKGLCISQNYKFHQFRATYTLDVHISYLQDLNRSPVKFRPCIGVKTGTPSRTGSRSNTGNAPMGMVNTNPKDNLHFIFTFNLFIN